METRGKTNPEFRSEVHEILSRHETSFDVMQNNYQQLNHSIQAVVAELQAMRMSQATNTYNLSSEQTNQINHSSPLFQDRNHTQLKLFFPKFGGDDPTGWIYEAEQYFEFKGIDSNHQVYLASFYLEGIALQWHRWLTKFCGPLTWEEFTKALLFHFDPTEYENP
ncbi:hypothetical protein ACOSQ3_005186 [Xanthoceras sorbifolium]